ncbi:MAG: 50S ribosomal protein L6 [Ruminococcaceae bacterium]|nr:50S ribosomal protein L6 [Oscillospiraceae bacterium]
MSRIGRIAVTVPAGVEVSIAEGNVVTAKGPKGTLVQTMHPAMIIRKEGATVVVERPSDEKEHKSLHGLTRTLVNNMVVGVSTGYKKQLDIVGVGYRAAKQGTTLQLSLGYSHGISFEEKDGITFEVPNANTIIVHGADKQKVGQIAAQIREKRPPEPYLGKGVKYTDEVIRRKSGKAGK